jgi:hypothetical protein
MSITIKHKMKNLKGIKTMLKGNKQIVAFEEARKIERQAIKKGFEDSCRSGKALVEVDKYISSKAFKDGLTKLEAKMTKKEFVKEVLGMSFGGYTEYIKIGKATKPQRDNFLKGCEALEKEGKSVARSIKNFCKYLSDVAKNDGGESEDVEVQAKETSKGMFQLKLTIDQIVHDVRVDLTSNGAIKTKNEAQAIIKSIDTFKALVLQGLQSASDKAPKKAPKKVAVK